MNQHIHHRNDNSWRVLVDLLFVILLWVGITCAGYLIVFGVSKVVQLSAAI